jgi:hypothetical protein
VIKKHDIHILKCSDETYYFVQLIILFKLLFKSAKNSYTGELHCDIYICAYNVS